MGADTSMKLFRLPSQSDDVRGIFSVHASLLQNDIPGTSFTFSLLPGVSDTSLCLYTSEWTGPGNEDALYSV